MKHLFIIDPFPKLIPGHDTSLALMRAAIKRGHEVWQTELSGVRWRGNMVFGLSQKVFLQEKTLVTHGEKQDIPMNPEVIVWMRKDPPVDYPYIRVCQLLRVCQAKVLNNPNTLMTCDEKLFALEFPDLIPTTYVSQNIKEIRQLVTQHQQLIAKPIGGKGGEGILMLSDKDRNVGSIIEMMTEAGQKKIIIQEYLPQARQGDKRILLLNGDPMGALVRIPQENDHRGNMAAGACASKADIPEFERQICAKIKPRLLELGLHFVGLDVIGDKVTEINITSPTCIEEISEMQNSDLASQVIAWSESL